MFSIFTHKLKVTAHNTFWLFILFNFIFIITGCAICKEHLWIICEMKLFIAFTWPNRKKSWIPFKLLPCSLSLTLLSALSAKNKTQHLSVYKFLFIIQLEVKLRGYILDTLQSKIYTFDDCWIWWWVLLQLF